MSDTPRREELMDWLRRWGAGYDKGTPFRLDNAIHEAVVNKFKELDIDVTQTEPDHVQDLAKLLNIFSDKGFTVSTGGYNGRGPLWVIVQSSETRKVVNILHAYPKETLDGVTTKWEWTVDKVE